MTAESDMNNPDVQDVCSAQSDATTQTDNAPFVRVDGPLVLRGRQFSSKEIDFIRSCVNDNFAKGRTAISVLVCEHLNWKQPNGWLKDRACRDVLRQLEDAGVISLPKPLTVQLKQEVTVVKPPKDLLGPFDFETPLTDMPSCVSLKLAKGNKDEEVWNQIVTRFHYLSHNVIVGRCLKYLVYGDGRVIGAISFSSPAWNVSSRDTILRLAGFDQDSTRERVINNSRFLILPFVNVKNLASMILARSCCQVVSDWTWYYAVTPDVVETFVQPSLYSGTCYRAANWRNIGLTRGYGKRGTTHHNSQEPKHVYIFGLHKKMRRRLEKAAQALRKSQDGNE